MLSNSPSPATAKKSLRFRYKLLNNPLPHNYYYSKKAKGILNTTRLLGGDKPTIAYLSNNCLLVQINNPSLAATEMLYADHSIVGNLDELLVNYFRSIRLQTQIIEELLLETKRSFGNLILTPGESGNSADFFILLPQSREFFLASRDDHDGIIDFIRRKLQKISSQLGGGPVGVKLTDQFPTSGDHWLTVFQFSLPDLPKSIDSDILIQNTRREFGLTPDDVLPRIDHNSATLRVTERHIGNSSSCSVGILATPLVDATLIDAAVYANSVYRALGEQIREMIDPISTPPNSYQICSFDLDYPGLASAYFNHGRFPLGPHTKVRFYLHLLQQGTPRREKKSLTDVAGSGISIRHGFWGGAHLTQILFTDSNCVKLSNLNDRREPNGSHSPGELRRVSQGIAKVYGEIFGGNPIDGNRFSIMLLPAGDSGKVEFYFRAQGLGATAINNILKPGEVCVRPLTGSYGVSFEFGESLESSPTIKFDPNQSYQRTLGLICVMIQQGLNAFVLAEGEKFLNAGFVRFLLPQDFPLDGDPEFNPRIQYSLHSLLLHVINETVPISRLDRSTPIFEEGFDIPISSVVDSPGLESVAADKVHSVAALVTYKTNHGVKLEEITQNFLQHLFKALAEIGVVGLGFNLTLEFMRFSRNLYVNQENYEISVDQGSVKVVSKGRNGSILRLDD